MGNWHIEMLEFIVTIADAAGRYFSGVNNLERPGSFMGGSVVTTAMGNNDNSEAVGSTELRNQVSGALGFGDQVTGVVVRVNKQAGTAGNTVQSFIVMVYIRDW